MKKTDLSIIIPSLITPGRSEIALKECLTSLFESGFSMENVIIASNGQNLNPIPSIQLPEANPDIHRIHNWRQGQCMATNAAIATVNTEWIMITNDDMVFPPDWFERLTSLINVNNFNDVFESTYSPQLIEPRDGAPTFKKVFCGGIGGDWDKQKFMDYAKTHQFIGTRSGFNFPVMMKKEVWDSVGGYDVNYDPWGSNSDSDLEYKLKLAGVRMWQVTECPVYHFSNTSDTFVPENNAYWQKNWQYFINKWGFERTDDGIWEASFEIPMNKLIYKPSFIMKYGKIY